MTLLLDLLPLSIEGLVTGLKSAPVMIGHFECVEMEEEKF